MQPDLTEQEIQSEVNRLAPFYHKVELPYGLSTVVPEVSRRKVEYTRIANLVKHAFPAFIDVCGGSLQGKRVLDIACNCGGFALEAAKLESDYVLGIDIVDHYIEQANFIKRALGLNQIDFKLMNVENLDESTVGLFDVSFCFGILYHLENPIQVMKKLASVTKSIMLVDTAVVRTPVYLRPLFKMPMWQLNFPPISTADSKYASTNLWRNKEGIAEFRPNEGAVVELLKFLGFSQIVKIKPTQKGLEKRYYNGKRVTFLAIRS